MTELVAIHRDLDAAGHEAVSPVPELVRVAVVGLHRQIDMSLPLDVPVALLVPEVARLFDDASEPRPRSTTPPAGSESRRKDVIWALVGAESGASLAPDVTLRGAKVARDDVLYLRGRQTLAAPTLYDDVVDAAARLNQSGHPGWDPAAARRIAFLGVGLAAAAWVYLVSIDGASPRRVALLGLSAFVTVTLLVGAAIFARSGGAPRSGAVLGWASLPVAAAACWAGLSPHGSLALAGGALALVLLSVAGYRLVGAGVGGFTAAGAFFACGTVTLALHAAGLGQISAVAGLAVFASVATLAVPRLTARLDYSRPGPAESADGRSSTEVAPPPGGEDVGRRVGRARSLRGGLLTGLSSSACLGAAAVVWGAPTPSWPTLAFAVVCAAALGLPRPGVARAAAGLPAVALVIALAVAAAGADETTSLAGASVLLMVAIGLAAVGYGSAGSHPRWRALLPAGSYVAFALIGPCALWAVGAYSTWGVA